MNLLRVVLAMAWADDSLEQKEVNTMLIRFSQLFATAPQQQSQLQSQLTEYFVQEIPLPEAVSKLTTPAEKEVALRLSYEVINASARTPNEAKVNEQESSAYNLLLSLLKLPADVVERAEKEATAALNEGGDNIIDMLAFQIKQQLAT
ncbi:MAG: TerB family tellurite resistance protein [Cyanobacteria bacterium P01_D01_bin.105]